MGTALMLLWLGTALGPDVALPPDAAPPSPQATMVHSGPSHGAPLTPRMVPLTPAAVWDFLVIGSGVFVAVVEDNPVTFGLVAGGLGLGAVLAGGVVGGAAGVVLALALSSAGLVTGWPLALVVAVPVVLGLLGGVGCGAGLGLPAGFWASIDQGELSF